AHRDVGAVPGVGRRTRHAEGEQQLAVRGELADRVVAVVDAVHRAVGADLDAVRVGERAVAPGAQELAVRAVHEHLVVVAGEQVHLVGGVDRDAGHVAVADAGGSLLPVQVGRPAGLLAVRHAGTPCFLVLIIVRRTYRNPLRSVGAAAWPVNMRGAGHYGALSGSSDKRGAGQVAGAFRGRGGRPARWPIAVVIV